MQKGNINTKKKKSIEYSPFYYTGYTLDVKDFFIGREKELTLLKRYLLDKNLPVVITGPAGVGKTSLARIFAQEYKDTFPGGVFFTYATFEKSISDYVNTTISFPLDNRTLIVIDEAHALSNEDFIFLRNLKYKETKLSLLILGQFHQQTHPSDMIGLELGGLSKDDFKKLILTRLKYAKHDIVEKFYNLVNGNPAIADATTSSIRDGVFTLSKLWKAFEGFESSGILGPDGKPYHPSLSPPPKLITDIREVNDELLTLLKADPELLRKLPPRKFEEIVAELLSRLDYKVELTPATRDGGFDIYAAKSDTLGTFLFLVECKQYTPPSKVGVQVVRSLYGTVQQTKATAGILVTTSFFTKVAKDFQREIKYQIQLRDFFEIKKWLGLI